jgi:hypothetical protein
MQLGRYEPTTHKCCGLRTTLPRSALPAEQREAGQPAVPRVLAVSSAVDAVTTVVRRQYQQCVLPHTGALQSCGDVPNAAVRHHQHRAVALRTEIRRGWDLLPRWWLWLQASVHRLKAEVEPERTASVPLLNLAHSQCREVIRAVVDCRQQLHRWSGVLPCHMSCVGFGVPDGPLECGSSPCT